MPGITVSSSSSASPSMSTIRPPAAGAAAWKLPAPRSPSWIAGAAFAGAECVAPELMAISCSARLERVVGDTCESGTGGAGMDVLMLRTGGSSGDARRLSRTTVAAGAGASLPKQVGESTLCISAFRLRPASMSDSGRMLTPELRTDPAAQSEGCGSPRMARAGRGAWRSMAVSSAGLTDPSSAPSPTLAALPRLLNFFRPPKPAVSSHRWVLSADTYYDTSLPCALHRVNLYSIKEIMYEHVNTSSRLDSAFRREKSLRCRLCGCGIAAWRDEVGLGPFHTWTAHSFRFVSSSSPAIPCGGGAVMGMTAIHLHRLTICAAAAAAATLSCQTCHGTHEYLNGYRVINMLWDP